MVRAEPQNTDTAGAETKHLDCVCFATSNTN